MIRDLWQKGTDSVNDMCVVNTNTKSYVKKTLERCLHEAEKVKNKNYLETCLQQHYHFFPFFISVYGLLGVEAEAALKIISSHLEIK